MLLTKRWRSLQRLNNIKDYLINIKLVNYKLFS